MSRTTAGRRPGWTAEEGVTLIELLVAAMIALIVLGGAAFLFAATYHQGPDITNRAADIGRARVAMERITREIRQAAVINTATASQLSMTTYRGSAATCGASSQGFCRVTYTCSAGTCSRIEALADGSSPGPSVILVTGLSDSNAFSYGGDPSEPSLVYVKLAFPTKSGSTSFTLRDAVAPRAGRL